MNFFLYFLGIIELSFLVWLIHSTWTFKECKTEVKVSKDAQGRIYILQGPLEFSGDLDWIDGLVTTVVLTIEPID